MCMYVLFVVVHPPNDTNFEIALSQLPFVEIRLWSCWILLFVPICVYINSIDICNSDIIRVWVSKWNPESTFRCYLIQRWNYHITALIGWHDLHFDILMSLTVDRAVGMYIAQRWKQTLVFPVAAFTCSRNHWIASTNIAFWSSPTVRNRIWALR